jgi:hypothetical protein
MRTVRTVHERLFMEEPHDLRSSWWVLLPPRWRPFIQQLRKSHAQDQWIKEGFTYIRPTPV